MMKKMIKTVANVLGLILFFLLLTCTYKILVLWILIELIIFSIKRKNIKILKEFICNFVITVLNCINILCNILFQVPANRILLTTTENAPSLFGNPKKSFTRVLRLNFVHGNLKPRGITLYKIITFFKKT